LGAALAVVGVLSVAVLAGAVSPGGPGDGRSVPDADLNGFHQSVSGAGGDVYSGELKNGFYHGQGKLTLPDGAVYEGQFADGLRHGCGVWRAAAGWSYEGDRERGVISGRGRMS
jgi:hypothetical protein